MLLFPPAFGELPASLRSNGALVATSPPRSEFSGEGRQTLSHPSRPSSPVCAWERRSPEWWWEPEPLSEWPLLGLSILLRTLHFCAVLVPGAGLCRCSLPESVVGAAPCRGVSLLGGLVRPGVAQSVEYDSVRPLPTISVQATYCVTRLACVPSVLSTSSTLGFPQVNTS